MIVGILLAVLIGLLFYSWVAYPLILALLERCRATGAAETLPAPGQATSVAILLSAHNEERFIGARLANLIEAARETASEAGRMEILVGVDGSDDGTARIAREWASSHPVIRVHDVAERRGKIRMLKDLVSRTQAGVLVFTDANTMFRSGAVPLLLRHLRDVRIGGVCGRLVLKEAPGGQRRSPEGSYWRWETRLKAAESDLDSCLGANGAIYAVRRELFWADIPDNTIVDDFVIGMKVREQGRRVVYEPGAVAEEELPALAHEWRRRVRIGSGDFQAFSLCRRCLLPRYGRFAWAFWSHKVLRWFTPHVMILAAALALWRVIWGGGVAWSFTSPLSLVVVAGGCLLLLAAAAGRLVRSLRLDAVRPFRLFLLADHFLTMQLAVLAGFLRFLRGDLRGHWTRTPRA